MSNCLPKMFRISDQLRSELSSVYGTANGMVEQKASLFKALERRGCYEFLFRKILKESVSDDHRTIFRVIEIS